LGGATWTQISSIVVTGLAPLEKLRLRKRRWLTLLFLIAKQSLEAALADSRPRCFRTRAILHHAELPLGYVCKKNAAAIML
jgi:hypothetical protein